MHVDGRYEELKGRNVILQNLEGTNQEHFINGIVIRKCLF